MSKAPITIVEEEKEQATYDLDDLPDTNVAALQPRDEKKDKKKMGSQPGADLKFAVFCALLDKLSSLKSKQKLKLLESFFENYLVNQDPYPIIRLLLPQLDRERGMFGLKEQTLAKFYTEIMMLPKSEGERLKHYKNPTKQPFGAPAGDFVTVMQAVMQERCRSDNFLSVADVNGYLDELAMAVDNADKKAILAKLLNDSTLNELKWITRVILKDLKIGIGHETVLKNYHPDAVELYNVTSDLKEVFQELHSKEKRIGQDKFRIFFPIKPMLADKMPLKNLQDVLLKCKKVMLETKFDGERIQCHIKDEQVKFFSRNANHYTYIYGPKMGKVMRDHVNAKSCILDGEMVVYDKFEKCIVPYGQNKTVALNEDAENEGKQLCYMIFDILYVQGKQGEEANLMNAVLEDRKMVLERVVKHEPHLVEIVKGMDADSLETIYEEFNKSVINNEEGIIVKQYNSLYKPGERSNNWIKLKGEYIDNLGDSLDLLIIGGYYGEGKRTQGMDRADHISTFLLGVREKTNLENPKESIIYPFCRVGTGYSMEELGQLRTKLNSEWDNFNPRMAPSYYKAWKFWRSEMPDLIIKDPSKSVVLEVRAAEIEQSDKYPTRYTLRFPRVIKIRYDKNWDEGMDVKELASIIENFGEERRLKRKHKKIEDIVEEEKENNVGKKKRGGRVSSKSDMINIVLPRFQDTDTSAVVIKSNIFRNCEFYVINVDEANETGLTKASLERYIVENGGAKVQNLLQGTSHLIAGKHDFKVNNIIKSSGKCVIHHSWIIKCIEMSTLVDLTPKYIIYGNAPMLDYFSVHLDKYNDNYIKALNTSKLTEIMSDMPQGFESIVNDEEIADLLTLRESLIRELKIGTKDIFKGETFYFPHSPNFGENSNISNMLRIQIEKYGGTVSCIYGEGVTVVIAHGFLTVPERQKFVRKAKREGKKLMLPKDIFATIKNHQNTFVFDD